MKVWTSYFAMIDKLRLNGYSDFIAVSGLVPEFYQDAMENKSYKNSITFRRLKELAPQKEWFFDWKAGKFGNEEYIRLYRETVLNKLNFEYIKSRLNENSVLLCYEKRGDFCHRHLIADWLKENGIDCEEIENV